MQTCNWTTIVPWGLVILGWWVVHIATLARERRKERREAVVGMIDELMEIEREAMAFHRSSQFDAEGAEALTWRVGRAIRSIQRQPLSVLSIPSTALVQYRRNLTLRNLDSSSFKQQVPGSPILKDVRYGTDQIIELIEASRDTKLS